MFHFFSRISFVVGVILGILLAVIVTKHNNGIRIIQNVGPFGRGIYDYQAKLVKEPGLKRHKIGFDELRYGKKNKYLESAYLYDKVNVLCIILLQQPKNEQTIQDTWSKSCNYVKFVNVTKSRKILPSIKHKDPTSWTLLCRSFLQVPDDVEWVLVVSDYTFVIVENLRLFIASLNHLEDYYFGHAVSSWGTVYNTGHAGYVFSKGSLQKLISKLRDTGGCENRLLFNKKEDFYVGKYFASLNITPSDTRDHEGFSTFHPYNLNQLFSPNENQYQYSVYPVKCCSKYSVTFQSIDRDKMYTYFYLLYTLQVFYTGQFGNLPRSTKNDDKIWKDFLREQDLPFNVTADRYYQIWVDLVDDPTKFAKHFKYKGFFDYN